MRSTPLFLAALSQFANAEWFIGQRPERFTGNDPIPRMTMASGPDGVNGWTPKPTEAPAIDDRSDPRGLLKRSEQWVKMKRQQTWTNSKTCGWFSRGQSDPFTCTASETCTTNTDNVVACETDGSSTGFFTACFDYNAYTKGACSGMGAKTGCCWTSSIGACITYIWPGSTALSMYRCHTSPTIVTMLAAPRSVIEGSISSTSLIITSSSSSSSSSSTTSTSGSSSSTNTGTGSPDPDDGDGDSGGGGGSNAGAIAGGVVGGVAGAAILAGAIIFIWIKRRGPKNAPVNPAYSVVAPTDTSYHGGPPGGYAQSTVTSMTSPQYFPPPSTTLPPSTPYMASGNPADQRYSYYDQGKPAEQQQGQYPGSPPILQQQFTGGGGGGIYPTTTPSPHNSGGYPAPGVQQYQQQPMPPMPEQYQGYGAQQYQQPQGPPQFVSELDNTATAPQMQHGHPVEMPINSPGQREQQ